MILFELGFLIRDLVCFVLVVIINNGFLIEKVYVESMIIFFRVFEKVEEVLKFLFEEFNGEVMFFRDVLDEGEVRDIVIVVIRKRFFCFFGFEEVEGVVFVREYFLKVYCCLSIEVLMFFFKLMLEWNEIMIKIYDMEKRYEENIVRFMMVFEDFDLGFVVGEGWDWDYLRLFMCVLVYKFKFLIWEDFVKVKFFLKGFEYRDYKRFCDIDVFVEGKKIDWIKFGKFDLKFELVKVVREELEKYLSEDVKKRLYEIEEKFLKEVENEKG